MRYSLFFFFNDTATTEIYTLSLHDALPILPSAFTDLSAACSAAPGWTSAASKSARAIIPARSEEHTSELQSHSDLVCRLLLEKKKKMWQTVKPRARGKVRFEPDPRRQPLMA